MAIQTEIEMGADIEMATVSSTNPLKPIFLAFLHDHNQVWYADNKSVKNNTLKTKMVA